MDAILGVDDEAGLRASCLVGVDHLVNAGWTIESRRLAVARKIVADRGVGIVQAKMDRLILFMVGVGKKNRRCFVKC